MTLTRINTNSITDGSIVNADISASAAIAGTKISPDFGSQNIVTTGGLTVDTNTLVVDAPNNRVGIGSTAPSEKLTLSDGNIRLDSTTSTSKIILFHDTAGLRHVIGSDATAGTNEFGLRTEGQIIFGTGNRGEAARIDASKRLLVGTSSARNNLFGDSNIYSGFQLEGAGIVPANRFLSIVNNYDASADGDPMLVLGRTRGSAVGGGTIVQSGDQLGAVSFQGSQGSSVFREAARIQAFVDGTPGANDMPGRLVFSVTADGASSPTARMVILNTGELRLGSANQTTISTDACHTIGAVALETVQTNLARLVIQERANNWISFKSGSGTHYGTISVNGAGVTYGSNSDYRLKENVFAIGQPVEKLKLLKPCQYNFIAIPGQRVDGFLAHELQEVVPSAVSGTKDATDANGNPEYQTVDASKLVPLLTAALQEAVAKIESLEARLTAAGI